MRHVYLDHNATTPPHPEVLDAMAQAARDGWANPSSLHAAGRAARRHVDDARDAVARLCGESARDVVFTSGGTEANNLALCRLFPDGKGLLVTSRLEHPSVLSMAEELAARGITVVFVEPARSGHLLPETFAEALSSHDRSLPALLAVHAVHHETGAIQPIEALVALAQAHGAQIHVDAVQAAGRVPPERWRGADTVALASHKLRGPKGIGAVVSRPGAVVRPILRGGSQERGLRPGTVDPIAASGFGVAATIALAGGPERYQALAPLRDRAERAMLQAAVSLGLRVTPTVTEPRAPHVAHVIVDGFRGDELVAALDLEGVCVSSGSACAAGTAEPSPAIAALVGPERATFALRVSLGETTTEADIERFEAAFMRVLARASES